MFDNNSIFDDMMSLASTSRRANLDVGAECHKPYECNSRCCLPGLDKDGKFAEFYPNTGLPIRRCEPIPYNRP